MSVQGLTVVLDPGHGGYDQGAMGPNGANESQVALSIAKKTQLYLSSTVDVYLTRTEDKALTNPQEEALLKTDDFQERAAWARSGIASFIGVNLHFLPDLDYSYQETPLVKLIRKANLTEHFEKNKPVTVEMLADILDKLGIL